MDDQHMRQIAEQMNAVATASTDMTGRLIFRLINLKKISPGEGALILGDLVGHHEDLAKRNAKAQPGAELVYRRIAEMLKNYKETLEKETGAKVETVTEPRR